MTQFDFGFGLVNAHRHPNGFGWVQDTAQVSGRAQVFGNAQVYGEARVSGRARVSRSPLHILGFEFPITAVDNQVQVGCKTILPKDLVLGLFPEEVCPRLRDAAPELIVAVLAHWKRCAR